jgi:hypothetical protein
MFAGKDKSVVYVSNHLTEMDMPFMWLMPYRAGAIGYADCVSTLKRKFTMREALSELFNHRPMI